MPWRLVVGDYGYVGARDLPVFKSVYTYKASECKRAIIRLHCATSKFSLWNMEYVARGGAFERPRIYRTSTYVHVAHLEHSVSWVQIPPRAPTFCTCALLATTLYSTALNIIRQLVE